MTDEKKPKFVTIVSGPGPFVIGDPDLSDAEREAVREAETRIICPLCRNGLCTNEQFKRWRALQDAAKTQPTLPDDPDPEDAA